VQLSGPSGKRIMDAKVVGFTERISSILVPENFLQWANVSIAHVQHQDISRVIVKLKSDNMLALTSYLDKHSLKIGDDKIRYSKMLSTLNVVMSILVFIGTAFMVFALVIVMLNFSLMIAQAKEEVSLLLQLGYKTTHLVRHLSMYLIVFMISVVILAAIVIGLGNDQLTQALTENGLEVSGDVAAAVVYAGAGFVALTLLISYYSIYRLINRQTGLR